MAITHEEEHIFCRYDDSEVVSSWQRLYVKALNPEYPWIGADDWGEPASCGIRILACLATGCPTRNDSQCRLKDVHVIVMGSKSSSEAGIRSAIINLESADKNNRLSPSEFQFEFHPTVVGRNFIQHRPERDRAVFEKENALKEVDKVQVNVYVLRGIGDRNALLAKKNINSKHPDLKKIGIGICEFTISKLG